MSRARAAVARDSRAVREPVHHSQWIYCAGPLYDDDEEDAAASPFNRVGLDIHTNRNRELCPSYLPPTVQSFTTWSIAAVISGCSSSIHPDRRRAASSRLPLQITTIAHAPYSRIHTHIYIYTIYLYIYYTHARQRYNIGTTAAAHHIITYIISLHIISLLTLGHATNYIVLRNTKYIKRKNAI